MNTAGATEVAEGALAPQRPEFLRDLAPTRGLERITPLSRPPATGRIGELFHVAAERFPDSRVTAERPPDIEPGLAPTLTYAELAALVDRAAGWLYAAGVRPWMRVAIVKANHFDVNVLEAAAARIGAIAAPWAWTHSPEVLHELLRRVERPVLVCDRAQLESAALTEDAVAELTERTIVIDGAPERSDVVDLDELRGAPVPAPALRRDDEPMIIPHTSGTTGVPKLVIHSATSIHAQAHIETDRWPVLKIRREDRILFADPHFHTRVHTAMTLLPTVGPDLLLLTGPDPEVARRLIPDFRPTVAETLPNIFLSWEPLARDPSRPFRDVRLYVNSFDAIHTRTLRTFLGASERRLPIWWQSFSQSECGGVAIRLYVRHQVRRIGHRPPPNQVVGWPQPLIGKHRIVDPDTGAEVPQGQPGLVYLSLPGRCHGYVAEQHRHDLKRDGEWWNTGDMGVVSKTGALTLLDREVDRVEGISCIEIEDLLLDRLPQTTEVIVLGVPDSKPVPVLSTTGDGEIDSADWAAATADLPPLADPIRIAWEEFPRTATWKIARNELRRRLFGAEPLGKGLWT